MFLDLTDFSGKSAGNSGNLMLPLFEKSAGNLGAGNLGNNCNNKLTFVLGIERLFAASIRRNPDSKASWFICLFSRAAESSAQPILRRSLFRPYSCPAGRFSTLWYHFSSISKIKLAFLKLLFIISFKNHLFTISLDENDYINASYCDGFEMKKKYICTQGPKENTIPHFWQMVWESNSRVIVMTTKLFENDKKKCDLYWPLEGERKIAGAFLLTNVGETVEEEHFTRTTIQIEFECQTRTIFHFAFRKVKFFPNINFLTRFLSGPISTSQNAQKCSSTSRIT